MSKYKIEKLDINEYSKCNNIWDMAKCPFTKMFEEEIIRETDLFIFISAMVSLSVRAHW